MSGQLLEILEKERDQLVITLGALDHLISNLKAKTPMSWEELQQLLYLQYSQQKDYGFPYFGTYGEKILFAVKQLGRFSRKEDVVAKVWEYQQHQKPDNISTILSRLVKEARLVSMKINGSNMYVFYGLPSFIHLPHARIRQGFEPLPEELEDIRVKKFTMQCGGRLKP